MFHTNSGFRLTPSYDQVNASFYKYKTIALALGGASDMPIGNLKAKNIIILANEFGLPKCAINMIFKQFISTKDAAEEAIYSAKIGSNVLKDQLIKLMRVRWNVTFALIGQTLLKKP
jgi:hypothetical protein